MIWCSSQETISRRGSLSIFGWEKTTSGWKGLHLETGECPVILWTCLEGLKGRVGAWFVFWGRHGALKSDIEELRRALKRYHDKGERVLDRETVMGEYLEIQRVVVRVENLLRDRRLER